MNSCIKIIFLIAVLLFSNGASAQLALPKASPSYDNSIYQDPEDIKNFTSSLSSSEEQDYIPYSADVLDNKKAEALQNNDSVAMYAIGMMYAQAVNVNKDFTQAREWFLQAAKLGNSDSMIQLARISALDKEISGFERNDEEVRKWIEQAVRNKNPKAYVEIGRMYEIGFIYEINIPKAIKFYQLAAQVGNTDAYAKLATIFLFGKGVDKDIRKAINYLRILKKLTSNEGVKKQVDEYLAQIYFELALEQKNGKAKYQFFHLAWDHGNKKAADAIADMYFEGIGVKKDYLKALEWYEQSATKFESAYALERIGFMYLQAPGDVERDYQKAMGYFLKASRQGSAKGAYMIGYMYENGLGVAKDQNQATTWYGRSQNLESRFRAPNNKVNFINIPSKKPEKKKVRVRTR